MKRKVLFGWVFESLKKKSEKKTKPRPGFDNNRIRRGKKEKGKLLCLFYLFESMSFIIKF